jgi:hypothetical protein
MRGQKSREASSHASGVVSASAFLSDTTPPRVCGSAAFLIRSAAPPDRSGGASQAVRPLHPRLAKRGKHTRHRGTVSGAIEHLSHRRSHWPLRRESAYTWSHPHHSAADPGGLDSDLLSRIRGGVRKCFPFGHHPASRLWLSRHFLSLGCSS